MGILSMISDITYKSILNRTNEAWKPQNRVTVVQTTTNQGICSKDNHFLSKILSNSTKVIHHEEAGFTSILNMFWERKVSIEPHT